MADSGDSESIIMIGDRPITSLKCNELKEELEKLGLSKSGNKKDLVERLSTALNQKAQEINETAPDISEESHVEDIVEKNESLNNSNEDNHNGDIEEDNASQSSRAASDSVEKEFESHEMDEHDAVELQANVSDDEELNENLEEKSIDFHKPDDKVNTTGSKVVEKEDDNDLEEGEFLDESEESDVPVLSQSSRSRQWGMKQSKSNTIKIDSKSLDNLLPNLDRSLKPNIRERLAQMIEEDEEQDIGKDTIAEGSEDKPAVRRVVSVDNESATKTDKKGLIDSVEAPSHQSTSKPSKKKGPKENKLVGCPVDSPIKEENSKAIPAKHPVSDYVFIYNLVRPFTVTLLKEMLMKHYGDVTDIWLDRIKSKSIVQFASKEIAEQARNNLHGSRWPSSNPKFLETDYSKKEEFDWMKEHGDSGKSLPVDIWGPSLEELKRREEEKEKQRKFDAEKEKKRKERENEKPRKEQESIRKRSSKERDRHTSPKRSERERSPIRRERSPPRRDRSKEKEPPLKKRNPPETKVREWDLNKKRQSESPKRDTDRPNRRDKPPREAEKERKRSPSPPKKNKKTVQEASAEPERKKKREEPAKLLDDLFYKTKATPSIYWLPLTEEQAKKMMVEREERRKQREADKQKVLDVVQKNLPPKEVKPRSPARSSRLNVPSRERKRSRSPPARRR